MHTVFPVLCRVETGGLVGLAGCQPHSRYSESPPPQENMAEEHPVSSGLHISMNKHLYTHVYKTHTHTLSIKNNLEVFMDHK